MDDSLSAADLLKRWRQEDQVAARRLFARYSGKLASLVQRHLNRRLVRRLDADDVVQSVFRTFFRRVTEGEFRVKDSSDLWYLLVKIAPRALCGEGGDRLQPCS